jgi:predicted glycosyltransferase
MNIWLEISNSPHINMFSGMLGDLARKAYGYPVRVGQLWNFLKDKKIDEAVSQSSFQSPVVARLLGGHASRHRAS